MKVYLKMEGYFDIDENNKEISQEEIVNSFALVDFKMETEDGENIVDKDELGDVEEMLLNSFLGVRA